MQYPLMQSSLKGLPHMMTECGKTNSNVSAANGHPMEAALNDSPIERNHHQMENDYSPPDG